MKKFALALVAALLLPSAAALAEDDCAEVAQSTVETKNTVMVISTDKQGLVTIVKVDKVTERVTVCTANGTCTPLPQ